MVGQSIQIFGDADRLFSFADNALAPTGPVEGDDAIAGLNECRYLLLPVLRRPGVGVQEDDRIAGPAGIHHPELHIGQLNEPRRILSTRHRRHGKRKPSEQETRHPGPAAVPPPMVIENRKHLLLLHAIALVCRHASI